jgi:cytoskeleton protein RodZ
MLQDRKSNLAEGQAMMSSYDDEFRKGAEPSAARVGADLKAARERLGWKLPAVSGHLRIRLPYLQAIEDGRVDLLPGNAYAIGFLRTYAQALGLDPDEVARRFRAEASETIRKTELNFPAPVPERGVPAGAIVLVGALIAIGAYAGWYKMSGSSRSTAAIVQPVPERLAPLADKAAPVTAPSASLTPLGPSLAPAPTPFASRPTAFTDPPPPLPSVAPSSAAAAVVPLVPPALAPAGAPLGPAGSAQPSTPTIVPGSDAAESADQIPSQPAALSVPPGLVPAQPPATDAVRPDGARPDGARMVLRAKSDAWIQVREKSGAVLLSRVLRAGETWPVPDKGTLLLTTGNAGGTEILVDGQPTGSLGTDGGVRRDLPLDIDAIKDGKLGVGPSPGGGVTPVSAAGFGVLPAGSGPAATKKP